MEIAIWTNLQNLPDDSVNAIRVFYEEHNIPFLYRFIYLPNHLIKRIKNMDSAAVNDEIARDFFTSWKFYLQITWTLTEEVQGVIDFCTEENRTRLASLLQCLSYERTYISGELHPNVININRCIEQMVTNFLLIRDQIENVVEMEQFDFIQCAYLINTHLADIDIVKNNARTHLASWQKFQNFPDDNVSPLNLEIIRNWFIRIYNHLNNLNTLICNNLDKISNENRMAVLRMISDLCVSSLFYEEKPKQIIIKGQKFTVKLKYLIPMNRIKSTAYLITSEFADDIKRNGYSGNIILEPNHYGILDKNKYDSNTPLSYEHTSIVFRDMSIKKICRKKPDHNSASYTKIRVTEQKAFIFFINKLIKNGNEYFGWMLSMPTVVIVHTGDQEYQAWAKIIWENTILKYNEEFIINTSVQVEHILEMFSSQLVEIAGKGLSIENKDMIRNIFTQATGQYCGQPRIRDYDTYKNLKILGDFSFWDWLYNAMKLLKDHDVLHKMWNDGLFIGFMSKQEAEMYLTRPCVPIGAFIIRFSESSPGAITVSCKIVIGHRPEIIHSQIKKKLLKDTEFLRLIFSKSQIFQQFYPNIDKTLVMTKYMPAIEPHILRPGYHPIADL